MSYFTEARPRPYSHNTQLALSRALDPLVPMHGHLVDVELGGGQISGRRSAFEARELGNECVPGRRVPYLCRQIGHGRATRRQVPAAQGQQRSDAGCEYLARCRIVGHVSSKDCVSVQETPAQRGRRPVVRGASEAGGRCHTWISSTPSRSCCAPSSRGRRSAAGSP